jgi:glycosyltransferase involved in cell wall biosynthesis
LKKLSIITINYNNAFGLQKTIESVVNQNFDDFEYIVIDGGSSDESKSIIEKYQSKIDFWVSEKDNGIYNAQNKGILKSKGEYCLFLNSGDYLYRSDVLMNIFKLKHKEDFLACDMIFNNGSKKNRVEQQPNCLGFLYMMRTSLWHPATLIKRSLFEKYGMYNEKYKIASDYDFFLKTTMVEFVTYKHIHVPLSVFDVTGISSNLKFHTIASTERKLIQQTYFNQIIIDAVTEYNEFIETEDYRLFVSLREKFFFKMYRKLYKLKQYIINKIFL